MSSDLDFLVVLAIGMSLESLRTLSRDRFTETRLKVLHILYYFSSLSSCDVSARVNIGEINFCAKIC